MKLFQKFYQTEWETRPVNQHELLPNANQSNVEQWLINIQGCPNFSEKNFRENTTKLY